MGRMYLLLVVFQFEPILWLLSSASAFKPGQDVPISLPGCKKTCGNVPIPYPFGIGSNCSHHVDYEILCNTSSKTPFLHKLKLEVVDIRWAMVPDMFDGTSSPQVLAVKTAPQNLCQGRIDSVDLGGTPYRFSTQENVLMVKGCSGLANLNNGSGTALIGCASFCSNSNNTDHDHDAHQSQSNYDDPDYKWTATTCDGVGCCKKYFPTSTGNLDFYQIDLLDESSRGNIGIGGGSGSSGSRASATRSQTCEIEASLIDRNSESNTTTLVWSSTDVPVNKFANCSVSSNGDRYCRCSAPYFGNPYLPDGCLDANNNLRLIQGLILGIGLPLLLAAAYHIYRSERGMMDVRRKSTYFKRNGGLLLQQDIYSKDDAVEKARIFGVSELRKATNNFNKNRILGQGGQGTVYKGKMTDGKIVAVKRSRKVDESQLQQFINEVVILSQVNHRNVVKLLGCCLETEVPLLVYEFIPNGTLYHYIHDPRQDFQVSWKMRLRIATESANALAHLHSASCPPIYHRDIKSTNILLDDKYRAKVADFGTSKIIAIDQTHVTTCVQGTYGYLDPEYFQSNQFTEKSDVYSFGVVLVELMTSKKPVFFTEAGEWIGLAREFVSHMGRCKLDDIFDNRLVKEENKKEFMGLPSSQGNAWR